MAQYPYTPVTAKLKALLQKARSTGVPQKLTSQHLKTLGFTSSNDASLIGVLKFIGLVDSTGVPTPLWSEYRGNNHKAVLAKAIKAGYAELFALYPDANLISGADLTNVFSMSSSAGEQVIKQTVQTFKSLVEEADFSPSASSSPHGQEMASGPLHVAPAPESAPQLPARPAAKTAPEVHIDIQIHISPESSADQIEKIFESMAKHLYGARPDGAS